MNFFTRNCNVLNYGNEFIREECSLTTYGEQGDCSLLIDNTHLTLDFDIRTNKVIGISGFLGDLNHMERKEIIIPSYSIASLFVDSEIAFQPGIGYGMGMKVKISYDFSKQTIMLENLACVGQHGNCYLVSENMYVSIFNNAIMKIYVCI